MSTQAKRVEGSKAEITITAKWENVEKRYCQELDKFQSQATLPGFRKGKAPKEVIEKKFGSDAKRIAILDEIEESMKTAIEELEDKSLRPIFYSQPELVNYSDALSTKKGNDVVAIIRYEVNPEINVKKYKGIEVEYPNVIISDKMIDNEIERYREQNAEIKSKDDGVVENGDLVTLDYTNLDLESDDKTVKDYTCTVGKNQNYYKFDDKIVGMKKDEEKEFVIKYTQENKPEGLDRDEVKLSVKIKSIKSKILPAVDDEFAQDIKSEYKTVADLKKGIKETLEKNLDERLQNIKIDTLLGKILEDLDDITLPQSMVETEIDMTFERFANQMGMSKENMVKFLESQGQTKSQFTSGWYDDAKIKLKKELILSKVEELEKIEPDKEKVEAVLKAEVPADATADGIERFRTIVEANFARNATIEFLIENNKFKPGKKQITYEDFASGAYKEDESEEK